MIKLVAAMGEWESRKDAIAHIESPQHVPTLHQSLLTTFSMLLARTKSHMTEHIIDM